MIPKNSNTTFKLSIDNQGFNRKPTRDKTISLQHTDKKVSEISMISMRISKYPKSLTIKELADRITKGITWSPFVFKNCPIKGYPRRLQVLFESCQAIALDFDNLPQDVSNREQFLEYLEEQKKELYINIAHTSFSHIEDKKPRFRAIMFFDKPITDINLAKKIIITIHKHFDCQADSACIDLARLFFGSTPDSILHLDEENLNSLDYWAMMAQDVVLDHQIQSLDEKPEVWSSSEEFVPLFRSLPRNKQNYIRTCVDCVEREILEFKGQENTPRYTKVWKSASYLARKKEIPGYLIKEVILGSIKENDYFKDWDYNAESVVTSAIEWSKHYAHESELA